MADSIVHNHTPKSDTEKPGLLARLHITDSSPSLSDEEEKKKDDQTMKEKVEEKFEEDKVKMNVKIIQGSETALNLKQKIGEQIEMTKEKIPGYPSKSEEDIKAGKGV
uniref:uncharacterized protein LOC122588977 n=1 Tax=Erigeron canadensis TaxID=72917 RepID=UPI001CB8E2C6|nr:uncharacterized protein LOC122588977 [Erigeron canadensis]